MLYLQFITEQNLTHSFCKLQKRKEIDNIKNVYNYLSIAEIRAENLLRRWAGNSQGQAGKSQREEENF